MAKNYIASGEQIDLTSAAANTYVSGTPVLVGTKLAIPLRSSTFAGEVIPAQIVGIWDMVKATGAGTNWAQGAIVYWDDTAKKVTGVSSGNTAIGTGALIAAVGDAVGRVRLNG